MNTRTTFVLVGALAVLLAVLVLTGEKPKPEGGARDLWPDFRADDVTELSWTFAGKTFAVRRSEAGKDDWTVKVAGFDVPASGTRIGEILGDLERMRVENTIPADRVDAQRRRDYGLAPPVAELSLRIRGEKRSLDLGNPGLRADTSYAQEGGRADVYLVDRDLMKDLEKIGLEDLRRKKILGWLTSDVRNITIEKEGEVVFRAHQDREDLGIWKAEVPFEDFADTGGMESELLPAILTLEVEDFTADGVKEEDLGKYGLAKPRYRLVLVRGEKEERTEKVLLVGADVPEKEARVYFMEEGVPFVYSGKADDLLEELAKDPAGWRDRNLTRLGYKVIDRIEASLDDVSFALEREDQDWSVVEPERMEVDQGAVENWLEGARKLTVKEFLDDPDLEKLGLKEPRGKLAFYGPKEGDEWKPLVEIHLGAAAPDGGIYARRDDSGRALVVGPGLVEQIRAGTFPFRRKEVFRSEVLAKQVVRLTRRMEGREEALEWKDGSWPGDVVTSVLNTIVARLHDLRAVRWVGPAEGREEAYGVGEDAPFVLTVAARDQDAKEGEVRVYGVRVGKPAKGGFYARAIRLGKPGAGVFVIAPADLESLKTDLRKKAEAGPEKEPGEKPGKEGAKPPGEKPGKEGAKPSGEKPGEAEKAPAGGEGEKAGEPGKEKPPAGGKEGKPGEGKKPPAGGE